MSELTTTASAPSALNFQELAREVARQPDLFASLAAVAEEQAIVRAAKDRRYTGDRVPEARATQIVALRISGCSLREIGRRTGADHRTVSAVVALAEQQGFIPTLKDVVQRQVLELTEETIEVVRRELRSDSPDAQLIKAGWVGTGIGMDKSAMVSAVGELHLHLHQGAVAAGPDPAAEYARLLRGAPAGPTVDAESEVSSVAVPPIAACGGMDTELATPPAPLGEVVGAPDPAEAGDLAPGDAGREAVGATGGAGGVANPRVGGGGDGKD